MANAEESNQIEYYQIKFSRCAHQIRAGMNTVDSSDSDQKIGEGSHQKGGK